MKKAGSFILHFVIYIALVGGIVWGLPKFLSWKLETQYPIAAITSGSMWPVLKKSDLVFIQKVSRGDLKEGDIIVWQNERGFTIHRIVRIEADTLVTKGDANFTEDPSISYGDVIGRTVMLGSKPLRIPMFGSIAVWSNGFKGANAGE